MICRAAWAVMLVLHGVWLLRSFESSTVWFGQQFALGLSIIFFGLKSVDVAALRFNLSRRALVAAVVIVALLHAGAIDRSIGEDASLTLWTLPVLAGVPSCMKLCRLAVIRRLLLRAAAIGHVPLTWTRSYWHHYSGVLIRHRQQYLVALCTPRAPPA